jgi:hypothetical protein
LAVGLAGLMWSCSSSNQNGYEVEIPVIDAPNLNGQEKTLPPISVPVSLSESNPSYDLGFAQTRGYAGLLRTLRAGDGSSPLIMSMDGLSFQADGTVDFFVRVFSRIGRISGRPLDYQPVNPASCTFTLDPNTASDAGSEYANNVSQCVADWIRENGVPYEFDMQVTSAGAGGSLPAAVAKSGFVKKANASFYLFSGNWNMRSENPCDFGLDLEVLDAVIEGEDFFGLLDCGTLGLAGVGNTDSIIVIAGGASIWDACGNELNYAELPATVLLPGTYGILVAADQNTVQTQQNIIIDFFGNDPATFTEDLLSAASGACANGPDVDGTGFAIVDWVHCGEVPRMGNIKVVAAGFCSAN